MTGTNTYATVGLHNRSRYANEDVSARLSARIALALSSRRGRLGETAPLLTAVSSQGVAPIHNSSSEVAAQTNYLHCSFVLNSAIRRCRERRRGAG